MDIKIGEKYVNKTWRFLTPCLRGHGDVFIEKFNSTRKLAIGIHDTLLDGSLIANDRNIYTLIDKKAKPESFNNFMEFIINQFYYKTDYCFDANIIKSRKHMVVLRIPYKFDRAYDKFLQGKYSEMYKPDELKVLFSTLAKRKDLNILKKSGNALNEFVKIVNKEFDVKSNPDDFKNGEWELPLKKKEEIFNYPNGKGVFFNEKLDKVWQ